MAAKKLTDAEKLKMMSDFDVQTDNAEGAGKVAEVRRKRRKAAKEKVHFTVYLSPEEYERLNELAQTMSRPMTYVCKTALDELYERTMHK